MRTAIAAVLAVLWVGSAAPGQTRLANEKELVSAGSGDQPLAAIHSAQLSPDGRKLLYIRIEAIPPAEGAGGETRARRSFRLVLRDVATKTDTALPLAAGTFDDAFIMLLSKPLFSPDSRHVVTFVPDDADKNGIWDHRSEKLHLGLYDIQANKLARLDLTDDIILPNFLGNGILVVQWKARAQSGNLYWIKKIGAEPAKLETAGVPVAVHPSKPQALLIVPKAVEGQGRPDVTLKLLDVAADKVLADLPADPKNSKLDDFPPRFTQDAKYAYYVDAERNGDNVKPLTRLWNVEENKAAMALDQSVPVGPAGGGKMVLVRTTRNSREGDVGVHDPAANTWTPLSDVKGVVLWAGDGKIIFARKRDDGNTSLHLAELK